MLCKKWSMWWMRSNVCFVHLFVCLCGLSVCVVCLLSQHSHWRVQAAWSCIAFANTCLICVKFRMANTSLPRWKRSSGDRLCREFNQTNKQTQHNMFRPRLPPLSIQLSRFVNMLIMHIRLQLCLEYFASLTIVDVFSELTRQQIVNLTYI